MRPYPHNSPEAMARVVVMCMLADSDLDPSELDATSLQTIFAATGLDRHALMRLIRDYLHDIADDEVQSERINLLEPARINLLLAEISSPALRLRTLACALSMCKADHALNTPELALFRHIMQHWQLDLADLARAAGLPNQ